MGTGCRIDPLATGESQKWADVSMTESVSMKLILCDEL